MGPGPSARCPMSSGCWGAAGTELEAHEYLGHTEPLGPPAPRAPAQASSWSVEPPGPHCSGSPFPGRWGTLSEKPDPSHRWH